MGEQILQLFNLTILHMSRDAMVISVSSKILSEEIFALSKVVFTTCQYYQYD